MPDKIVEIEVACVNSFTPDHLKYLTVQSPLATLSLADCQQHSCPEIPMRSEITRRRLLKLVGAGSAAAVGGGIMSSVPARAEDVFTIANTGGSWGEGVKQAYSEIPKFAETHGIKVSYSFDTDLPVTLAKVMARCGKPAFSVVHFQDVEQFMSANGGCLQPYDLDIVTNYKDIYKAAVQPPTAGMSNWCAAHCMVAMGLLWNTKEVKKPTSWMDMWDPKYKGRVGLPAWAFLGQRWMHALNRSLGGTEANIDPAIKALVELRKNDPVPLPSMDQAFKAVARGDVVMTPFWNGRTAELQSNGSPVDIVYPKGSLLMHAGFVIPKGTDFPELANKFIQNTLDPEFQLYISRRFRYAPSNRKAKLPPDLENLGIPEDAIENSMTSLDWIEVNKHRDAQSERWNNEVLG